MKWKNRNTQLSDELSRLTALEPNEILAVPEDATPDAIKCAYRKLVRAYHPDKADPFMRNHNEQVAKIINVAYAQLMKRFEADKS